MKRAGMDKYEPEVNDLVFRGESGILVGKIVEVNPESVKVQLVRIRNYEAVLKLTYLELPRKALEPVVLIPNAWTTKSMP